MTNEWEEPIDTSITTEKLDASIVKMQIARRSYEDMKAKASTLHDEWEAREREVLAMLKAAGKSKYHVDDLGTVSIRNRYVVRSPKDLTAKLAFFHYILEKHGKEVLIGLQSIQHQSLNAFYNAEMEANPEATIPGLEPAQHEESVVFRSK